VGAIGDRVSVTAEGRLVLTTVMGSGNSIVWVTVSNAVSKNVLAIAEGSDTIEGTEILDEIGVLIVRTVVVTRVSRCVCTSGRGRRRECTLLLVW
jgi:hypothetical protein